MRLFRRAVSHPDGELRYGVRTRRGHVVGFVVQLYCLIGTEWHLVAQFDHNPGMEEGHDVGTEGIHMDAFRRGEKYETETDPHPEVDRSLVVVSDNT